MRIIGSNMELDTLNATHLWDIILEGTFSLACLWRKKKVIASCRGNVSRNLCLSLVARNHSASQVLFCGKEFLSGFNFTAELLSKEEDVEVRDLIFSAFKYAFRSSSLVDHH